MNKNITSYNVNGLLQWRNIVSGQKFNKRLKQKLRTATKKNGKLALELIRNQIASDSFKKNADLTIAIKGSSEPLIDTGKMLKELRVKEIEPGTVFVGIPKSSPSYKVSVIVHEGAVVPVTPSMRFMFMLLYAASHGSLNPDELTGRAAELFARSQDFYPISAEVNAIIIPGRPFIRMAFEDWSFIDECKKNWAKAVGEAMSPRQGRQAPRRKR
jgi:hypothetical protein